MKARDRFELIVTRGGSGPVFLAERDRRDRVEIVSLDEGEVVFLWEEPPRRAKRLAAALREDLGAMEAAEFLAAWREAAEPRG